MGIQINGQTDTISAADGGLVVTGADFTGVSTGTASAPSISPSGDSNTGIFFPAPDTIAFAEGGVESVRIDSSGNVGIGTINPSSAKLHVFGGSGLTVERQTGSTIAYFKNTGSATPNIAFQASGTTNTPYIGVNNDDLLFGTSALERVRINSSGDVGIARATPQGRLHVGTQGVITAPTYNGTGEHPGIVLNPWNSGGGSNYELNGDIVAWGDQQGGSRPTLLRFLTTANTNGATPAERMRITNNGTVLVGTSTSRSWSGVNSQFQIETISITSQSIIANSADIYGGFLLLGKSRGTSLGSHTIVQNNDIIGKIHFSGADGSVLAQAAAISAEVDGNPGISSMPGRIVFSTTAAGAASPTERARITSAGFFKASNSGSYHSSTGEYHEFRQTISNSASLVATASDSSYVGNLIHASATRSATNAYSLLKLESGAFTDAEFNFAGNGNAFADGTFTGGGADYAEYFEWSDSNPEEEDRRGISVVLDDEKIRKAVAGEDPIGVISGNPSVVGDAAWNKWSGKYLRDEFGTYILEDYEVEDEGGNTVVQQRRKLNPAYDPDAEYIPREQRPEWDCVGLMGKLRIRKGQVTGSRWIKMRDISDTVEEWLVR